MTSGIPKIKEFREILGAGGHTNFCYVELITNIKSIASVCTTSEVLVGIVVPGMTLGLLGNCRKHVLVKRDICVLSARCLGDRVFYPYQDWISTFAMSS